MWWRKVMRTDFGYLLETRLSLRLNNPASPPVRRSLKRKRRAAEVMTPTHVDTRHGIPICATRRNCKAAMSRRYHRRSLWCWHP